MIADMGIRGVLAANGNGMGGCRVAGRQGTQGEIFLFLFSSTVTSDGDCKCDSRNCNLNRYTSSIRSKGVGIGFLSVIRGDSNTADGNGVGVTCYESIIHRECDCFASQKIVRDS